MHTLNFRPGITAVILAAGQGERFGYHDNKVLRVIGSGQMILEMVLERIAAFDFIQSICCVVDQRTEKRIERWRKLEWKIIRGGNTRMESVRRALEQVDTEWTLIHDGSRPCIRPEDWRALVEHRGDILGPGAILATPIRDSLGYAQESDSGWFLDSSQPREGLWQIHTPQIFPTALLKAAFLRALQGGKTYLDESAAIRALGYAPGLVEGHVDNIKLTFPKDWAVVSHWLLAESKPLFAKQVLRPDLRSEWLDMRVGQGFDLHRYDSQGPMRLGGIICHTDYGLKAHSDGDVLLHALMDALLGAAGLDDIGTHFPSTDPSYKDVDSQLLLAQVLDMLRQKGFSIRNIDITIVGNKPMILPMRGKIRANIGKCLELSIDHINIKATTTEGMGALGRGEGLACWATALLCKKAGK